ncbi:hypothetical protein FOXB_15840, partial [Fusarium oxysporum f. sp. conglutinans Fo5176]
FLHSSKVIL